MDTYTIYLWCMGIEVVVAVLLCLLSNYMNARYSTQEWPENVFICLLWPLMLLMVIIFGPLELARNLGTKARVKRMEAERKAWHDRQNT